MDDDDESVPDELNLLDLENIVDDLDPDQFMDEDGYESGPDEPLVKNPWRPSYRLTGSHLLMMMTMNNVFNKSYNEFFAFLSNIIGFYLFTSIADDTTQMYMPRNFTQFIEREPSEHIQNYQNYFNEVLQRIHKEKMLKAKAHTAADVEREAAVVIPDYKERILDDKQKEYIMSIINGFNKYIDKLQNISQAHHILVNQFNKNTQIKVDALIVKILKNNYPDLYSEYYEIYKTIYYDGIVEPTQHNRTDESFDEYMRMRIENRYSGVKQMDI